MLSLHFSTFVPPLAQVSEDILSFHLQNLMTPEGITGALLLLTVPVWLLMADRVKWAVLAVLIHVCTYSVYRGETGPVLTGIMATIATFSQPVAIAMVVFLAVPAIRPVEWRRSKLLHPAAIAFFTLQLVVSIRMVSAGIGTKGAASGLMYIWMFFVLGIGVARGLPDLPHIRGLLRAISGAAAITVILTVMLILFQPSAAMSQGRLYGTTANPQRLASLLALALPYRYALVMDRSNRVNSRIFHASVVGLSLLLILGSGSRMGGLMAAFGLALFFRARLGELAVGGILIGAFAILGYQLLGESISPGQGRVFSTTNTRSGLATNLIEQFMNSPFIGTPGEGAAGENGYLSVAAMYGLAGLLPLLVLLILMCRTWLRTLRNQSSLGEYEPVGDLVIAAIGQLLISWLLEAFVLGTLTDHTVMFYCTLALMGVVEERLRENRQPLGAPLEMTEHSGDSEAIVHGHAPARA